VIRLAELDGRSVLELQAPGLMPFTPLMQRPAAMPAAQRSQECIDATTSLPVDIAHRQDLLALPGLFSKVLYDEDLITQFIQVDMVKDSLFIQRHIERITQPLVEQVKQARGQELAQSLEQGIAQGERIGTINTILPILETRFDPKAASALKPFLETIEESD